MRQFPPKYPRTDSDAVGGDALIAPQKPSADISGTMWASSPTRLFLPLTRIKKVTVLPHRDLFAHDIYTVAISRISAAWSALALTSSGER